jgi:TRAP-type C4-dicarboxylate transport system permease small subunit
VNRETGKPGLLDRAERFGRTAENAFLLTLLTAMLALGASQIVLRNFLGGGLAWADEALRIMVLWLALIGAVAASRDDRHISIDVASRILPPKARALVAAAVNLFTAVVCGALAWYAWDFVLDSREYEDQLLGGLPAWWFQVVMPVAFLLIAYRYLLWCGKRLREFFVGGGDA